MTFFDFTGGTGDKGHIFYHQRCGSNADYEIVSSGDWKLTEQVYKSYQGSTKLNKFYFGCRIIDPNDNNKPLSDYAIIRVNY